MRNSTDGAPAWLFSFVDLAFLMLIAMTQIASPVKQSAPDLGEMVVPRIGTESTTDLAPGSSEAWQLRVHPRQDGAEAPFELVRIGGSPEGLRSERFADAAGLRPRLSELEAAHGSRPLLAPHEDSRSQDMLDAAALLEAIWPGRRRVTVARLAGS